MPEPIGSAVAQLWNASPRTEESAFSSDAFRLLEANCASVYSQVVGSRISAEQAGLRTSLQNFFRWNGAPWYEGSTSTADETSATLHAAFLAENVTCTHLAPLDRLGLEDRNCEVRSVRFGPNEVALLSKSELAERIPCESLKRFGRWYRFPLDDLHDFYWLVSTSEEASGPVWKRTWQSLLHVKMNEINQVPLFQPKFPPAIEDAIFVLLLTLLKEPADRLFEEWKPFSIPWTVSFNDDPFADAPRSPDPFVLTRTPMGPPDDEVEVPDRSAVFELRHETANALRLRWQKLKSVLASAGTETASFNPLTKHFFVKALSEEGIDILNWQSSRPV